MIECTYKYRLKSILKDIRVYNKNILLKNK